MRELIVQIVMTELEPGGTVDLKMVGSIPTAELVEAADKGDAMARMGLAVVGVVNTLLDAAGLEKVPPAELRQ